MGRAVGDASTGAIAPSTSQRAGSSAVAATHRGGSSVTAETGRPMASLGTPVPIRSTVQSASPIAAAVGRA